MLSEEESDQEEEPCDRIPPHPPKAVLEPYQSDTSTNSLVTPDLTPMKDLLEGPSTAPFHQPFKQEPPHWIQILHPHPLTAIGVTSSSL